MLDEPAPLTELEGIDLYDRTRLAEEGINNVEALAHTDIVELMSTRPASRPPIASSTGPTRPSSTSASAATRSPSVPAIATAVQPCQA